MSALSPDGTRRPQAVTGKEEELKDPAFRPLEADFGSAALGSVSSVLRIEVWEDANSIRHYLGQARLLAIDRSISLAAWSAWLTSMRLESYSICQT